MGIKEKLKEHRERTIHKVGQYVATHPNLSFEQGWGGVNEQWVSRAVHAAGQPARRPGRKKRNRHRLNRALSHEMRIRDV